MSVLLKQIKIPKPNGEQQDRFPFTLPLYKDGLELNFDKPVTILAGENASGKSTLLESLSVNCGFPIQGGSNGNIGRKTYGTNAYGEEVEIEPDNLDLGKNLHLSWTQRYNGQGFFFRAEYMTETLAQFAKANHYLSCSHGEGLLEVIKDRFRNGLFILDEPETALSPVSQLALISLIYENAKRYFAQYIIVTHSPILMAIPESSFYWIEDGKFNRMHYSECPHFKITKAFCENPDRMIKQLMIFD